MEHPEINPSLRREPSILDGERMVSSINGVGKIG